MAPLMVFPSTATVRAHGIPTEARRQMRHNTETRQLLCDSVHKIRNLFDDLGLIDRRSRMLWRRVGLWQSTD